MSVADYEFASFPGGRFYEPDPVEPGPEPIRYCPVRTPRAGQAVMPCADCGRMLDSPQMRRHPARVRPNGSPVIGRIVCATCLHADRAW